MTRRQYFLKTGFAAEVFAFRLQTAFTTLDGQTALTALGTQFVQTGFTANVFFIKEEPALHNFTPAG